MGSIMTCSCWGVQTTMNSQLAKKIAVCLKVTVLVWYIGPVAPVPSHDG